MTHASLFTGIGGFDLAAEWMGWENVFQCEIDQFCQKLLYKNFPNTVKYGDIKEFDGSGYSGTIDVLSGGFPCQPYSSAGKRKGKDDERHLWPEMLRVIREVSPRWVVGENVRGLINWNGGLVFDEVQADPEAAGYEVLPFLLPAAGINAPHRRDRIWFIAHSTSIRCNRNISAGTGLQRAKCPCRKIGTSDSETWVIADPDNLHMGSRTPRDDREKACNCCSQSITDTYSGQRCEGRMHSSKSQTAERYISSRNACPGRNWEDFPTQSAVRGGNDGISHRVDRLRGLGNAVVPRVVYQIFKTIQEYETLLLHPR